VPIAGCFEDRVRRWVPSGCALAGAIDRNQSVRAAAGAQRIIIIAAAISATMMAAIADRGAGATAV
jgi:hypothetical protein